MDRNMTLKIDPETMDIPLDEDGNMVLIYGDETTAQCVRLTLLTWKGGWPAFTKPIESPAVVEKEDLSHGTDYERIFGRRRSDLENDEVEEVLREAIFQETDVEQIDQLDAETDGRELNVAFSGTLYSGQTISMEVTQQ